ncbi:MAG: hypothetical protein IPI34_12290 [bacterium]|nr:hypothetical protein [bacterium]
MLGEARGDRGELLRGGLAPGLAVAEQAALRRGQAGEPGRVGVVDGGRRAVPVAQGCEIAPSRVAGAAEGPGGRIAVREAEDDGAGADLLRGMEGVAIEAVPPGAGVERRGRRIAARRTRVAVTAGAVADSLGTGRRLAATVAAVAGDQFMGGRCRDRSCPDEGQREHHDQGQAEPRIV